ncbi:MAG: LPS export ABC transporter periplasmic protein LptC [Elusimicrobia bacterium]|nr:LPS export ABC transporter periplasmic protein LptC [Elusimicrobiota bacterium]
MERFGSRLFFTALFVLFLAGCGGEKAKPAQDVPGGQFIKRFTAFESKDGKMKWSLVAEEAKVDEQSNRIELSNFSVDFFKKDGKSVEAVLTAGSGEMDPAVNRFRTIGDSFVKTADGELLETRDLYYDPEKKKIYGDSEVKLTRRDAIVTGKGIEATPDMESVVIKKNRVEIKR